MQQETQDRREDCAIVLGFLYSLKLDSGSPGYWHDLLVEEFGVTYREICPTDEYLEAVLLDLSKEGRITCEESADTFRFTL